MPEFEMGPPECHRHTDEQLTALMLLTALNPGTTVVTAPTAARAKRIFDAMVEIVER